MRTWVACIVLLGAPAAGAQEAPTDEPGRPSLPSQGGWKGEASYQLDAFGSEGSAGLLTLGLEADLEFSVGWSGARAFASILEVRGGNLPEGTSNIDADEGVSSFELWLAQSLLDGGIILRLGQMAADADFFVSKTGSLFLNGTFGMPAFLDGPAYPNADLGVLLGWGEDGEGSVRAAVYEGGFAIAQFTYGGMQGGVFRSDGNRAGAFFGLDLGLADGVQVFARCGVTEESRYVDGGIQWRGLEGCILGLAASYSRDENETSIVVEASVRLQISPRMAIQPDLQWLKNDLGEDLITGIRFDLTLGS